jgi:hypothetical protein
MQHRFSCRAHFTHQSLRNTLPEVELTKQHHQQAENMAAMVGGELKSYDLVVPAIMKSLLQRSTPCSLLSQSSAGFLIPQVKRKSLLIIGRLFFSDVSCSKCETGEHILFRIQEIHWPSLNVEAI